MIMAGYQSLKFVCYPISRARWSAARPMINWIAERELGADYRCAARGLEPAAASSRSSCPLRRLATSTGSTCPALIRGAEYVFEFPMVDRDPLAALDASAA